MQSFFLIQEILDTIEIYCSEIPIIIKNQYLNSISLFWEVKDDQTNIWEVFKSIDDRNSYFEFIKSVFRKEFPIYNLKIYYEPTLVEFDNNLASCIHLEWYVLP